MSITEKEKEILKLLCLSNPDIAKLKNIKICTVKTYIKNLLNKLVCSNRCELVIKAIKENIIGIEDIKFN